jgi:hypothetical protein
MMKKIVALLLAVLLLAMTGCGGKDTGADVQMDVQAVYDSMVPVLPEMLPMDEMMMLNFCGIEAEMCKQAVVSVCFDGLRADEIWLIEAKDADTLEQLEALAQSRLERKGEESITYSPEQYKVVQAAEVITAGNYLAVIVSPDVQDLVEIFNQAAK